MKNFNFQVFKKELKEKTIESLIQYKQEHGLEDVNGFAFYTDDSFMSIAIFIDHKSDLQGSDEDMDFHRFTVDEWRDETYPDKFHHISELLNENDSDDLFFDMEYIHGFCNCLCEIISEMKEEKYFDGVDSNFIWNIGISGYDNPPLFIDIFRKLNTAGLAEKFEKFLIKEYKTYPSDQWSYKKGRWVERY